MIYIVVLTAAAIGSALYVLVMYSSIPGAVEERLGSLEALPEHVNEWVEDVASEAASVAQKEGLKREERVLHVPANGLFNREKLVRQARYRDAATNKIVRIEPEEQMVRKRRRS